MRACENCEWWVSELGKFGVCKEAPGKIETWAKDWCGRFRAAERLAGGKDARK